MLPYGFREKEKIFLFCVAQWHVRKFVYFLSASMILHFLVFLMFRFISPCNLVFCSNYDILCFQHLDPYNLAFHLQYVISFIIWYFIFFVFRFIFFRYLLFHSDFVVSYFRPQAKYIYIIW